MKRLSKILMLVLVVALTLGCVFAIASSAEDGATGVSSSTVDFTGMTGWMDWKCYSNPGDMHTVGDVRVSTSLGGNSYYEWNFYTAPGQVNDAQYRHAPNALLQGDYGILEFDIATSSKLPNGFGYYITYNNMAQKEGGTFTALEVISGQLTSGGKVIAPNPNSDWTHITIVFDGVATTKTQESIGADGNPVTTEYTHYGNTVVKVYADGALISTSKISETVEVMNIRRAYVGWVYQGSKNIAANTSVAIDNWTETYCDGYLGTDEADLAQLFGENAIDDLANYKGTELKFNANGYTYPEAMGNAYVAGTNGNVVYPNVQAAINAIATRKIEGDIHLINADGFASANVTAPVTIYTHGLAMAKPTIAAALSETVGEDDMGETVYTYTKDENSVTFEYYATYEDFLAPIPMVSVDVKAGETPVAPVIGDVYNKEIGKVTIFKGWHYYDVDGNDLGTEMPAFTEENYGTIYCAVAETETTDVLFYTVSGETITYYANASDFTNANLVGKTAVLGGNITIPEVLESVTIDLNGYSLTAPGNLTTTGCYIYNSAKAPAAIYATAGALCAGGDGATLNIGYMNATTKADGRITLVAFQIAGGKGKDVKIYNVDAVNINGAVARRASWFGQFNIRGSISFENSDIYLVVNTIFTHSNQINGPTVNFTNTNIYAFAGLTFSYTSDGATSNNGSFNFNNSNIYGEFSNYGWNNVWNYNFTAGCKVSKLNADDVKTTIESGYWFEEDVQTVDVSFSYKESATAEEVKTVANTFTTNYTVKKAPVKATFNFYDVAINEVVTATPIFSQSKYLGETPTAPLVPAKQEGGKFYNVAGWIVYDAEGKEIGAIGAVTEEMNNQTYSVCPVWEEVTPAFAIVEGEVETLYPAESFISSIVTGKKLKLYADVTVTEQITFVNVDLNGYTINFTADVAFQQGNSFIYNTNTETEGHANFANGIYSWGQESATRKIYFGYSADGVKEEGKIVLTAGYFFGGKNYNYAYLYNVDYINIKAHDINSDSDSIFYQQLRGMVINIDNCNFYCVEPLNMVAGNQTSPAGAAVAISNTNFYGAGTIFGAVSGPRAGDYTSVLTNVKMYGGFRVFGNGSSMSWANAGMSVSLDENCIVNTTLNKEILPEGMVLVPSTEKVTLDKTFVGADGTVYEMKGEYAAGLKVGTAEEKDAFIKAIIASSYRNINLDVNINYNVYIPTTYTVAGATETITIGETEYWVVTFAKAPKDAIGDNKVTINVNGLAIEYNASVVNYVKALMNVESESEYAVASKNVAKYVLNYIKTVAVAANAEADVTAIDAILGDFTIGEITVEGAIENVAPIAGVEGVALELDSKVGMVIKVQAGYVGTITVSIAGAETVSKEYTEEAPAGEEEYIVIGDIEIFNFTNDVVITNGTETMTYNLATYVNNKKTDVAYATYAYAVQAKAYHVTYGAPNTID